MIAAELLDELHRAGATLTAHGDKLRCSGPPDVLLPRVRALLAVHKSVLLALLAPVPTMPTIADNAPADCRHHQTLERQLVASRDADNADNIRVSRAREAGAGDSGRPPSEIGAHVPAGGAGEKSASRHPGSQPATGERLDLADNAPADCRRLSALSATDPDPPDDLRSWRRGPAVGDPEQCLDVGPPDLAPTPGPAPPAPPPRIEVEPADPDFLSWLDSGIEAGKLAAELGEYRCYFTPGG